MTLDEIEKLEKGATPKPWRYEAETEEFEVRDAVVHGVSTVCEGCVSDKISLYIDGDAAFIAAARNACPNLIATIRAADEWLKAQDELEDNPIPQNKSYTYQLVAVINAREHYRKIRGEM